MIVEWVDYSPMGATHSASTPTLVTPNNDVASSSQPRAVCPVAHDKRGNFAAASSSTPTRSTNQEKPAVSKSEGN
jgi:hypothetical protein